LDWREAEEAKQPGVAVVALVVMEAAVGVGVGGGDSKQHYLGVVKCQGLGQVKAGFDRSCLGGLVRRGSAGHLVFNPLAPFLQALGMWMAWVRGSQMLQCKSASARRASVLAGHWVVLEGHRTREKQANIHGLKPAPMQCTRQVHALALNIDTMLAMICL
jgi:hypothetical protein